MKQAVPDRRTENTICIAAWSQLKTIGHLFYATSSFVQHFIAIKVNLNWSYSPETPNLGQIPRFLAPCDLEIWRMALKNNREPLLSNIKLYAVLSKDGRPVAKCDP